MMYAKQLVSAEKKSGVLNGYIIKYELIASLALSLKTAVVWILVVAVARTDPCKLSEFHEEICFWSESEFALC